MMSLLSNPGNQPLFLVRSILRHASSFSLLPSHRSLAFARPPPFPPCWNSCPGCCVVIHVCLAHSSFHVGTRGECRFMFISALLRVFSFLSIVNLCTNGTGSAGGLPSGESARSRAQSEDSGCGLPQMLAFDDLPDYL